MDIIKSKLSLISKFRKNRSSISPLNNFFKAPEIVIVKIVVYKRIWFIFAINLCPGKILLPKDGVGLKIL